MYLLKTDNLEHKVSNRILQDVLKWMNFRWHLEHYRVELKQQFCFKIFAVHCRFRKNVVLLLCMYVGGRSSWSSRVLSDRRPEGDLLQAAFRSGNMWRGKPYTVKKAMFRIRIRMDPLILVGSEKLPTIIETGEEISCFEVLDVLLWRLMASPLARTSFS